MRSNAKYIFNKVFDKLKKARTETPKVLANEGSKTFNENFRKQSFEGNAWAQVKRRVPGTFEYMYPKTKYLSRRTNPILIGKTRRLKNAVNRSVKSANINRIIWGVYGSEGKYGRYHNYGIGQKRRAFMANSPGLRRRLIKKMLLIYRSNIK